MAGNTFGERFRVTTFGESHGGGLGAIIDGCPAGHRFPAEAIAAQLARRRPGQSALTTQRKEADACELLSGVDPETGMTLGTPIAFLVRNKDYKSGHYADLAQLYRPSHADFTYDARFGRRAVAGGGRSSARETVARVAAGALAEDLLRARLGVEVIAWVERIAELSLNRNSVNESTVDRAQVDQSPVRCPDPEAATAMEAAIRAARKDGDSLGGVVRCVVRNVPPGLGEPVFDKLTAELAHAMMSLPATRGFEVGEGFAATTMRGSTHNDPFRVRDGQVRAATNHSGGIQGGISNGETIRFAVAFKPTATIFKTQQTATRDGREIDFVPSKGRHDPCVLPRAVPMVEAMAALVVLDHSLRRLGARADELSWRSGPALDVLEASEDTPPS
ncbi:chorismate synthase [Plesiocystis pacifica]|uniref:chorismate synthase n=1 Tax=Plesiocystis pacifica TaxID=191768 RepID=UPI0002E97091|nr:chorismate synthase [Plesiocystis pacifica]